MKRLNLNVPKKKSRNVDITYLVDRVQCLPMRLAQVKSTNRGVSHQCDEQVTDGAPAAGPHLTQLCQHLQWPAVVRLRHGGRPGQSVQPPQYRQHHLSAGKGNFSRAIFVG